MAGNNWVYLPKSREYVNLGRMRRVVVTPDLLARVLVDLPEDEDYKVYTGADAEALISALKRMVADGK